MEEFVKQLSHKTHGDYLENTPLHEDYLECKDVANQHHKLEESPQKMSFQPHYHANFNHNTLSVKLDQHLKVPQMKKCHYTINYDESKGLHQNIDIQLKKQFQLETNFNL